MPKTKMFRVWIGFAEGLGVFYRFNMETAGFFLIQICPCAAADCENGLSRRNSLNSTAIKSCISVDRAA